MDVLNVSTLYGVFILLFFAAAFFSLVFMKRQALCNILVNALCIAGSLAGVAAALWQLVSGSGKITMDILRSGIPYVSLNLTIDSLSAFFVLILSTLVLCVSIYSTGFVSRYYGVRNIGLLNFIYSTFVLSLFFVFTSGNAVSFFVAWEAMALLSYFLVVFKSENVEYQRAGTLYIIMTHIGTAFIMVAFMLMYSYTKSFDLSGSSAAIPDPVKNLMFILFLIGFGTKAGVIPVHIWLPYAYSAAPSNMTAVMSGVMSKTAVYGLIRFVLLYLGVEETFWGVAILAVGIISSVLGVAYALIERNYKRLLAFSSVENIGIIFIGLGLSFIALAGNNTFLGGLALMAALFHSFNHGLFKGGLFLGAGAVQYATRTKNMENLGGLIKKMPVTAVFILAFSIAISGIIPFNGFVSEWLIYQSLFSNIQLGQAGGNVLSMLAIAALALSGALAAACFIKFFGISFLGLPRTEHAAKATEVPAAMKVGMGLLGVFCLAAGIFPMVFLSLADRIIVEVLGTPVLRQLEGGLFFAYAPLTVSGNSISPLSVLAVLGLLIIGALLVMRIVGGKYIERKYGTWDCGFEALNSRMQYSATGFSKPLRIVFRILYRPGREVDVEKGQSPYFPQSVKYNLTSEPIFEKYLYNPVLRRMRKFSKRMKFTIQTGSIHMYLLYIFITLLALMLYNRLV